MNWLPLFVIVGVVVLIFYFQKCSLTCKNTRKSTRDDYGQDASIRATTGWIAGPMYGYDPIDQFAEEIEVFKADFRKKADSIGCKEACLINQGECAKCFQNPPRETLVIGVMPLDIPQNPEPGYKRRRDHSEWVPSDIEFNEQFQPSPSCVACS